MPKLLENAFEEGVLPDKLASKLTCSVPTLTEFNSICGPVGVPEYPFHFQEQAYIKVSDAMQNSFFNLCDSAWGSFIRVADQKRHVLEKEKTKLMGSKNFRIEWPIREISTLGDTIIYVVSTTLENQTPKYIDPCMQVPFFKHLEKISKEVLSTRDQGKINFFWTATGAYFSTLFDQYMKEKKTEGSTGGVYDRDALFRYQIMQPILKHFFKDIIGTMKGYETGVSFLKNQDAVIVEKELSGHNKEVVLEKMLLYNSISPYPDKKIVNYDEYRIARRQLMNYSSQACTLNGSLSKIIHDEAERFYFKNFAKGLGHNDLIEILIHNDAVIAQVSSSTGSDQEILAKFKNLSKEIIKPHDWLVHLIHPDIVDFSGTEDEENELYDKRTLVYFAEALPTGIEDKPARSMFNNKIKTLVQFMDTSDHEKIIAALNAKGMDGREELNNLNYKFLFWEPNKDDKSLCWKIASEYGAIAKDIEHLKGGDSRGLRWEGDFLALRWLMFNVDFFSKLGEKKGESFEKDWGFDLNYKTGVGFGSVEDFQASSDVIRRAKYLGESGMLIEAQKNVFGKYIFFKNQKGKTLRIKNDGVMFASVPGSTDQNLIGKLEEELATIQDYIEKNDKKAIGKLPAKIRKIVEEDIGDAEEQRKTNPDYKLDISLKSKSSPIEISKVKLEVPGYYTNFSHKKYPGVNKVTAIFNLGKYMDRTNKYSDDFEIYVTFPTAKQIASFFKNYEEALASPL